MYKIRRLISATTPPFLYVIFKKIYNNLNTYLLYKNNITKYDDFDLCSLIVQKNIIYNNNLLNSKDLNYSSIRSLYGIFLSIIQNSKDEFNIIDFGGGGGFHFFVNSFLLKSKIKFNWFIVETESMVSSSKSINYKHLFFINSLDNIPQNIPSIDLFFASSSFQYINNIDLIIDKIIRLKPKVIFITKTPFSLDEEVLGIKQFSKLSSNGPGPLPHGYQDTTITYPIYIVNLFKFLTKFDNIYKFEFKVLEESNSFFINNKYYNSYGLYLTLIDN